MGKKRLVVSQGRKVGFLKKFKESFFWWCGMGWLEKGGGGFFFFKFCDMVT
jgi:hypothetical protein